MLGAFAEYEREMVKERTQAGLKAARAQGRHGGRRPKFTQAQRAEILSMLAAGRSAAEVARLFQAHRATISRLNAASQGSLNYQVHATFENLAENRPTVYSGRESGLWLRGVGCAKSGVHETCRERITSTRYGNVAALCLRHWLAGGSR
jgi:hypothetical protein